MANFGTTQTVVVPGGTKVLVKVNASDKYSSEYYLRETNTEYRMIIRHSRPNPQAGFMANERHNVELTIRVTPAAPALPYTKKVYFVSENPIGDTAIGITEALFDWALLNTNEALVNLEQWQS